jgi:Fe-S-cluster containining protein
MDKPRVLWTFPDAALAYECRGCGACCKGLGIGLEASQVKPLLDKHPALAPFVRQRGPSWTAFNPRGGCWFLDHEGWCKLERAEGRSAKPSACRLFPFNRIFRLGPLWVVDMNSVICPLQAPPPGQDVPHLSGLVRHADLWEEISALQDPALTPPLPAQDPAKEGAALLARESAIAQACWAQGASGQAALEAQLHDPQHAAHALQVVGAGTRAAFGRPRREPEGEALRLALLLTPSLRFNELYGPRAFASRAELDKTILPRMWLLWLHLLVDAQELLGRAPTLQEMTSVWSEQAPLLWLLARWDHAPLLPRGPAELSAEGKVKERLLQLAAQACENEHRRAPLGALLQPHLKAGSPLEAVVFLRHVAALQPRLALRFRA